MADPNILLSENHPQSGRWAIAQDNGTSVWLYLTERASQAIVADCWLWNRIADPGNPADYASQGLAPPAPKGMIILPGTVTDALPTVTTRWRWDGNAVALLVEDQAIAFISADQKRGYCRHLRSAGPWGNPFDAKRYRRLFEEP
jgi:hypothetical protein